MNNSMYWAYNLPLQVTPAGDGYPARILNYMPRKECCTWLDLEEALGGQSREEFFNTAATYLENLARLMRQAASDADLLVYYHDDGMQEAS